MSSRGAFNWGSILCFSRNFFPEDKFKVRTGSAHILLQTTEQLFTLSFTCSSSAKNYFNQGSLCYFSFKKKLKNLKNKYFIQQKSNSCSLEKNSGTQFFQCLISHFFFQILQITLQTLTLQIDLNFSFNTVFKMLNTEYMNSISNSIII